MLLQRAALHSIIALLAVTVINAAATAAHLPGFLLVLGVIMTGHGLLFAASVGCAANNQKAGIFIVGIVALLFLWPPSPEHLVMVLVPIAAGILAGALLLRMFKDAIHTRRRPYVRTTQPVPQQPSRGNNYAPGARDQGPLERPGTARRPDLGTFDD